MVCADFFEPSLKFTIIIKRFIETTSRHYCSNWISSPRCKKLKKRRIFLSFLCRKRQKGWNLVLQFLLYIHLADRKTEPHYVECALFTPRFSFNEWNIKPWKTENLDNLKMPNSKVFGSHVTHEATSYSLPCISSVHYFTFYGYLVINWKLGPSENY